MIRLDKIFRQEILHLETINTKGRCAKGIVTTKVTDLLKATKAQKKRSYSTNDLQTESSTTYNSVIEQELTLKKAKRHHSSKEEKAILETLFAFDATPPDATIDSVLETLLAYWDGWTKKKIRDAWSYEKRKGKQAENKIQE